MKQIRNLISCALIATLFFVPSQTNALGRSKQYNDLQNPNHSSVPINGGLVVLLVAGVALGAKLIYDKSKKNKKAADTII